MVKFRLMQSAKPQWNGHLLRPAALLLVLLGWGCGIKTQVKVPIAPAIAAAKEATLQELLSLVNDSARRIATLSSGSMKVTLTTEKTDQGELQKYHSAPAYVLLRRPSDILLNVQNPITKTTILELLSKGDRFEIWNPGKNTVYEGRNSAAGFELDDQGQALSFSARPIHILDAILPPAITFDTPEMRISKIEQQDLSAKYYVLTLYRETGTSVIRPLRQVWIERSRMVVVREDTITESGQTASVVKYSNMGTFAGSQLARDIRIERPLDGYSLDLHCDEWRLNPDLQDSSFALHPSPQAERVVLKEKGAGRFPGVQ
jgi:hypothetical protein